LLDRNRVDELVQKFTVNEMNIAISSLKIGKSVSVDLLIPEIFKTLNAELAPILC